MGNENARPMKQKATTLSDAAVLRFEIEELIRFRDINELPEIFVASDDYMLKFALNDSRDVLTMIKMAAQRPALRDEVALVLARNIAARQLTLIELEQAT